MSVLIEARELLNRALEEEQNSSNLATSEPIVGSPDNDFLSPSEDASTIIYGNGGEDVIEGSSFEDVLYGGKGGDILRGNAGNDLLFGNKNSNNSSDSGDNGNNIDFLLGGFGDDTIYGGKGVDKLFGDEGNDVLFGERDGDMLFGGLGDDFLDGGQGTDVMNGDSGNDTLLLRDEADSFDIIVGFTDGEDVIALSDGLNLASLIITEAGEEASGLAERYLQENGGIVVFPNGDGSLNYEQVSANDLLIKNEENNRVLAVVRQSPFGSPIELTNEDFVSI
ncbi:MAG: calcium-binding protein [Okeania sp. SIO2H7]|nr:calcium-binding protein [Okeania sp. SIO2H7]